MKPEKSLLQRCQTIYHEHRNQVVIGRKTTEYVVGCLRNFIDIISWEVSVTFTPERIENFMAPIKDYMEKHEAWRGLRPSPVLYKVERNNKSKRYYNNCSDSEIFLLFEQHTALCICNCFELAQIAKRFRGIEPKDIAEGSFEFVDYMLTFISPNEW